MHMGDNEIDISFMNNEIWTYEYVLWAKYEHKGKQFGAHEEKL